MVPPVGRAKGVRIADSLSIQLSEQLSGRLSGASMPSPLPTPPDPKIARPDSSSDSRPDSYPDSQNIAFQRITDSWTLKHRSWRTVVRLRAYLPRVEHTVRRKGNRRIMAGNQAELFLHPVRSSAQLQFEQFYSARLRPDLGGRLTATELREAYMRFALDHGFGSLSFKQLRAAMEERGHRRIYSNGARYCDVSWIADGEAVAPPFDAAAELRAIMARLAQVERMIAPAPPAASVAEP